LDLRVGRHRKQRDNGKRKRSANTHWRTFSIMGARSFHAIA
jgi:hypothetical protein